MKPPTVFLFIVLCVVDFNAVEHSFIDICIYYVYTIHGKEMLQMYATIQRWGNSNGLRIPKVLLDTLGIRENDQVELEQNEDSITIRKVSSQKHKTLEDRLTAFYGAPLQEIQPMQAEEVDWGKAEGDEAW